MIKFKEHTGIHDYQIVTTIVGTFRRCIICGEFPVELAYGRANKRENKSTKPNPSDTGGKNEIPNRLFI